MCVCGRTTPEFVVVEKDGVQIWPWYHPATGPKIFCKDDLNDRNALSNIIKFRLSIRKSSLVPGVRADPWAR